MFVEFIEMVKKIKMGLSGKDVFTLYDTYGFSFDIIADVVIEVGIMVDLEGFESVMVE